MEAGREFQREIVVGKKDLAREDGWQKMGIKLLGWGGMSGWDKLARGVY